MGKTGVLHTSSAWGLEEVNLTFERRNSNEIISAYRTLQDSERKLYQEFGTNSYSAFIAKLRELFNPNDIKVINRFQPGVLSSSLQKFASDRSELFNQEVKLEFNFANIKKNASEYKIREIPKESNDFKVSWNGEIPTIKLTYNPSTIKQVLTSFFKGHNFDSTSDLMKNVDAMVNTLIEADGLTFYVKDKSQHNKYTQIVDFGSIPNFPWGLDKKTYTDAVKNKNQSLLSAVDRAIDRIKDFILNELGEGASPALIKSIKRTWNKNFNEKKNNPALFFSGGKTNYFISAVQGALGEFQTALIFTFLYEVLGKHSRYGEIVGNEYKKGTSEQLKTDVEIVKGLGIQVKNYNQMQDENQQTKLIRDIETNIHPNELARQLPQGQDFLDYIANYCFNTTFKEKTDSTYNEMMDMLNDYLGEVMNMAMSKGIKDKISFYMISSSYLVPASEILRVADSVLKMRDNIEITSSFSDLTDDQWNAYYYSAGKTAVYNGKKVEALSPNYIEYWTRDRSSADGWKATPKNKGMFKELVENRISIRTHFNLWNKIQQYGLF